MRQRLEVTQGVEEALHRLRRGQPAQVLIHTDGLAVTFHVHAADERQAEQVAAHVLAEALDAAGTTSLGHVTSLDVRPGWQPSHREPVMFRPWQEDDRPIWWVRCEYDAALGDDEKALLTKTVAETRLVRCPVVAEDEADRLAVMMLVRGEYAEVAEHTVSRVVEVASVAAGLPRLSGPVRFAAVPYDPARPVPWT